MPSIAEDAEFTVSGSNSEKTRDQGKDGKVTEVRYFSIFCTYRNLSPFFFEMFCFLREVAVYFTM